MSYVIEIGILHIHDEYPVHPLQIATRKTLRNAIIYLSKLPQKYRRVVLQGHVAIVRDDENHIIALLTRSNIDENDSFKIVTKNESHYYTKMKSFESIDSFVSKTIPVSRYVFAALMSFKRSGLRPSQDPIWDEILDECIDAISSRKTSNLKILLDLVVKEVIHSLKGKNNSFMHLEFRNILERTIEFVEKGTFGGTVMTHLFTPEENLKLCNAMREEITFPEITLHLIIEELRQASTATS